jgi:hypothetical protein
MANKPFSTYYGERILVTGAPPPEGDAYLVLRSGVVGYTTFGLTGGFAQGSDDSTVTTITTVDTWTDIANTLTEEVITPNLVFAANAFTYVGESSIAPTQVRFCFSGIKTGGASMVFKAGIAINGTPVIASTSVDIDAVSRSFVSTVYYLALQQSDVVTGVIKNIGGSDDIILTDVQLSIG